MSETKSAVEDGESPTISMEELRTLKAHKLSETEREHIFGEGRGHEVEVVYLQPLVDGCYRAYNATGELLAGNFVPELVLETASFEEIFHEVRRRITSNETSDEDWVGIVTALQSRFWTQRHLITLATLIGVGVGVLSFYTYLAEHDKYDMYDATCPFLLWRARAHYNQEGDYTEDILALSCPNSIKLRYLDNIVDEQVKMHGVSENAKRHAQVAIELFLSDYGTESRLASTFDAYVDFISSYNTVLDIAYAAGLDVGELGEVLSRYATVVRRKARFHDKRMYRDVLTQLKGSISSTYARHGDVDLSRWSIDALSTSAREKLAIMFRVIERLPEEEIAYARTLLQEMETNAEFEPLKSGRKINYNYLIELVRTTIARMESLEEASKGVAEQVRKTISS